MGVMVRCKNCGKVFYEGHGFTGPGPHPDGVKKCDQCGTDMTDEKNKMFVGTWD